MSADPTRSSAVSAGPSTSLFNTGFHGLNGLLGIGIVSMPYALASGGWLSLILFLTIAVVTFYTGLMIKRCMDTHPSLESFPLIVQRLLGDKAMLLVNIVMNLELYMVMIGFLILEGDNLNKLITHVHIEIGGLRIGGHQCFVILSAVIIMPTLWLDNLSILAYVSATGAIASVVFLCAFLWNGVFDGTGFHHKGVLIHWKGLPLAVSLYTFCYSAHPIFPDLYTSMNNKRHFSLMLLLCFALCTIVYGVSAVLGYLMFGPKAQSEVALDFPKGRISSSVVIYTTLISPLTKYPLLAAPIINAIKNAIPSRSSRRKGIHVILGTSILVSTVMIALLVPFFGYLMSLVGALLSVVNSFIIPSVCYLKISGHRVFGLHRIISYTIIFLGISIAVSGTFTSVVEIVKHLKV